MSDTANNSSSAATLGLTILGAASSLTQAQAQNAALRAAMQDRILQLESLSRQIRIDRLREIERRSRMLNTQIGNVQNAAPRNLAVITALANRVVANAASDQFAVDETARRRIAAIEIEKRNARTQARSGMVSPGLAAIHGGMIGLQQGIQLQGLQERLDAAETLTEHSEATAAHERLLSEYGRATLNQQYSRSALNVEFMQDAMLRNEQRLRETFGDVQ